MSDLLTITLFFDELPIIDPAVLAEKIAFAEVGVLKPDAVAIDVMADASVGSVSTVQFEGHQLKLVGIAALLPPQTYQMQLQNAHLRPEDKLRLAAHRAHLIVYYEQGSDAGVERVIALYKVALAFREAGLLGVMFDRAWMIQTAEMLPHLFQPDKLAGFRESPAVMLAIWLGYIKFGKSDGSWWLATKGGELYGLPNFAYLVKSLREADEAVGMFGNLLNYLYRSKAQMKAGHTAEVNAGQIRLRAVYEYPEFLGTDTLVIERADSQKKRGWFGFGKS